MASKKKGRIQIPKRNLQRQLQLQQQQQQQPQQQQP
jgi:hypothetical protein